MALLNVAASWDSVAGETGGHWLRQPAISYSGRVLDDSRIVKGGDLFVAIRGELADGFEYISAAGEAGAGAVCVDRTPEPPALTALSGLGVGILRVDNALTALHTLARAHRAKLRGIPLIAITGSSGKTSIRSMVQSILEEVYPGHVVGTEGNTNNHFGVPRNVFRLSDRTRAAVLELGTNHPGEIAQLAAIVQPDLAVVGNIGQAHIEHFGRQENIANEKGSVFAALANDGTAVMPHDGPANDILLEMAGDRKIITFGAKGSNADVTFDYRGLEDGTYHVCLSEKAGGQSGDIDWQIGGRHQAANAAAASAACLALGIEWNKIICGVRKTVLPDMRMEVRTIADITWYNDAYNANPESSRASLEWFTEATANCHGTRYVILGDMLELGPDHAPEAHRSLLREAVVKLPDAQLIGVGPEMENAGESCGVRTFAGAGMAKTWLQKRIKPGDCILLKGSRGTRLETILE